MRRKIKWIPLVFTLLLLIISGTTVYFLLKPKFTFNEEQANGNTTGNIYNGGYFCEYNDIIYFANPYDEGKLYSMNSDFTSPKKLLDEPVASINVWGNYIYYVKNSSKQNAPFTKISDKLKGVYRCDLNGKGETSLSDKNSGAIHLNGNFIYYQRKEKSNSSLYKIKINKTKNSQISQSEANPASIFEGKLYFSNTSEKNQVFSYDINSGESALFREGNTSLANMQGEYLYYIDSEKNSSLVRLNTTNQTVELLSEGVCSNYNLYENKIFYQKEGNDAGLYRMNTDGSNKERIVSGMFMNISCTKNYTFFQFTNNPGMLYRVPTTDSIAKIEEITIK